jgi:folate/biopterin transporter
VVRRLFEPSNAAILSNYFALGLLLKLPFVALRESLRHELGASPATQSLVLGVIVSLPWSLKIPIAFMSDVLPLCGMRRKPYMLIGSLLCATMWAATGRGIGGHSLGAFGALAFLATLGMLICDVMADAVVVERMREIETPQTKGAIQSACWVARFAGSIGGLLLGGGLLTAEVLSPRGVFTLTALVPLVIVVPPLVLMEDASARRGESGAATATASDGASLLATAKARAALIWSTVTLVSVWQPMLFVFAYAATPRSTDAFANFLLGPLSFSDAAYAQILAAGYVAQIGGSVLYSSVLAKMERRRMFALVITAAFFLTLTQLVLITGANRAWGVSDYVFAFGDEVVNDAAAFLIQMPIFVMCAELCPVGVEGSIFALTTTVNNVGVTVSGALGGALTAAFGVTLEDFSHLAALCTATAFASLIPLALLPLVRGVPPAAPPPRRGGTDAAGDLDGAADTSDDHESGERRDGARFHRGDIAMYSVYALGAAEGRWVEVDIVAVHIDDYTIRLRGGAGDGSAASERQTVRSRLRLRSAADAARTRRSRGGGVLLLGAVGVGLAYSVGSAIIAIARAASA